MIRKLAVLVLLGASALFLYLYYDSYFRWRDCFNELGRCFDDASGVVRLEQSGEVWLLLAVLTFGAALYHAWRLVRRTP